MTEIEPPSKKPKLKLTDNTINVINVMDKFIEEIKSSKKNLTVVLDYNIDEPLDVTNVFVGHIKNVKDIARTIQILNEKVPLKLLEHLKRAMSQKIILCPTTVFDTSMTSIQEFLECAVPELGNVFDSFEETQVPSKPPKTDFQCKLAKKLWSCNFHPNKYFEKLVGGDFFTSDELNRHRLYMEVVFEVARWYVIDNNITSNTDVFKNINTTIVVDPKLNSIVAIAFDNRRDHPIQHSAMLAIDNVAKTQYGGAWISEDKLQVKEYLKTKFEPLKYYSNEENQFKNDKKEGPYLCTGYYVYMLKEPCIMCGMALVHARAQRIFYCVDNILCGSLKSRTKLQTISSLNHRFEVFTGFL